MRPNRIALLLVLAFLFGSGSAEVAVQTHRALAQRAAERSVGSKGQLVQLTVRDEDGTVLARPKLVAAPGKPALLVLHDPVKPEHARLALRVGAVRHLDGEVDLEYELSLPERDVSGAGRLLLTPGVEEAVLVGDVSASFFTLPIPSAAFDAYLEALRDDATPASDSI